MPLGTSTAAHFSGHVAEARARRAAWPSNGRASPAPKSASTQYSAIGLSSEMGTLLPDQRAKAEAASPFRRAGSVRVSTQTSQPRSWSKRATTYPSPPLLPGPQKTAVFLGEMRSQMASAMARPAASMRRSPGMPDAMAYASARPIWTESTKTSGSGWRISDGAQGLHRGMMKDRIRCRKPGQRSNPKS